ncbi:MAG: mechanosensitive ion channel family protein [Firmicutes bacterium]|nr:mechanosensitive ion channel family protein [Bacillota bacterium]
MLTIEYFHKLPLGERLLWFVVLSFAGWLAAKLLVFIWEKLLLPVVSKTESSLDDLLAKNIRKPVTRLIFLGSIYLAAQITIISAHQVKTYLDVAEIILYLLVVLFFANLVNGIFKSIIDWYMRDVAAKTESTMDDTLFPLFRKAGTVIIYFIAITIVLGRFKVNLTGFLATAGIASITIAFAAQETLSNIIAGVSILLDRSYHVGERVELKDGLIGDVVEIGLRSTRIMSLDQRLIIVPNKEIAGSRLINWSQPNPATKVKLKIGVAMDSDLAKVKQVVLDVCNQDGIFSKTSPPLVLCTGFGPYFIELLVIVVVDDCQNMGAVTDRLVVGLQEAFQREGIQMPYPQQYIQVQQV